MSAEQVEEWHRRLLKAQEPLKDCRKMRGGRELCNTIEMLSHISKLDIRSLPSAAADSKDPTGVQSGKEDKVDEAEEGGERRIWML